MVASLRTNLVSDVQIGDAKKYSPFSVIPSPVDTSRSSESDSDTSNSRDDRVGGRDGPAHSSGSRKPEGRNHDFCTSTLASRKCQNDDKKLTSDGEGEKLDTCVAFEDGVGLERLCN